MVNNQPRETTPGQARTDLEGWEGKTEEVENLEEKKKKGKGNRPPHGYMVCCFQSIFPRYLVWGPTAILEEQRAGTVLPTFYREENWEKVPTAVPGHSGYSVNSFIDSMCY